MKRFLCAVLIVCLLISCMSIGVSAAGEPAGDNSRYTGLVGMTASLSISDLGRAVVSVSMDLRSGYKAQMHVDLHQEGDYTSSVPKSWDISISEEGEPWAGVWYVYSGYIYYATVTLDVYTTGGTYVETITLDSNEVYY